MAKALRPARWFAVPLAWLVLSCGGDSEPSDTTRNLSIQGGDNQSAAAGSAVTTPPSVKVGNSSGAGVSGVSVTFAVGSGGGTITGGTQTTNGQGIATVGGWTLGQTAGPNTLAVTVQGSSSTVTVNATGTAGAAAALAKTAGDNQSATVKTAVGTRPAVRVNDQFGNPVAGASVVFTVTGGAGTVTGGTQTTDAGGVATVGGWTLGPTNGPNQLSAAVQGIAPQVFAATGQELLIQPSKDTTFQAGTLNLTRLIIAAGRTVTVAGDLVINADSTVEIAGTLQGTCVALTLDGAQLVTVSGKISSACAGDQDPPDLLLVGRGEFFLTATGVVAASGGVRITNDPALTPADFPASGFASRQARPSADSHIRLGSSMTIFGRVEIPDLDAAGNGRPRALESKGDLEVGGEGFLTGSAGTDRQRVEVTTGNPAVATGAAGGDGGAVALRANGRLIVSGKFTLITGGGGRGGDATAVASPAVAGQKAATAVATAGDGGRPGIVDIIAGSYVGLTSLAVVIGRGGDGGNASATAANGESGKATGDGTRAQDGGNANATGGNGGSLPGISAPVNNVIAAQAGKGGTARAVSGAGANGSDDRIDGGHGGLVVAFGGEGGSGSTPATTAGAFRSLVLALGPGGDAGSAFWDVARGGHGWDNCLAEADRGGDGGNGGEVDGRDGRGGTGTVPGKHGGGTFNMVSNGGEGGDDPLLPGTGGTPGPNNVTMVGATTTVNPSFQTGQPGAICAGSPTLIQTGATVFNKNHDVGESSCPDLFADNPVSNVSGVPIVLQLSQTSGPPLINFQLLSGNLGPGGATTVKSSFNCGQARTFTAQLLLQASGNPPSPPSQAPSRSARAPTIQDVVLTYNVTARAPAVRLAHALGSFPVNQVIFLGNITGYVRSAAHGATCAVEHLHATAPAGISIQGTGPYPDPDPSGCGYGEVFKQALPPS